MRCCILDKSRRNCKTWAIYKYKNQAPSSYFFEIFRKLSSLPSEHLKQQPKQHCSLLQLVRGGIHGIIRNGNLRKRFMVQQVLSSQRNLTIQALVIVRNL